MEIVHPNYSTANSKEEHLAEDIEINPLPRAVLRPNSHIILDGEWRFSLDPEDKGLQQGWHLGHQYPYTAQWPGSIEEHMAAAKDQQIDRGWKDKVVAWYEREFDLPEKTNGAPTMIQLTFGACGYETQVWLNGLPLRTIEGEMCMWVSTLLFRTSCAKKA